MSDFALTRKRSQAEPTDTWSSMRFESCETCVGLRRQETYVSKAGKETQTSPVPAYPPSGDRPSYLESEILRLSLVIGYQVMTRDCLQRDEMSVDAGDVQIMRMCQEARRKRGISRSDTSERGQKDVSTTRECCRMGSWCDLYLCLRQKDGHDDGQKGRLEDRQEDEQDRTRLKEDAVMS